MYPGEEFEIRCYEYLKRMYSTQNVDFKREGGMDSTISDIAVIKDGRTAYYIEAKDSKAQSGQFVLIPNSEKEKFVFSTKNKSEENEMTDIIIDYMNNDFSRFNTAGTSGEKIDIDSSIFSDWIIRHYKEKGVKYIISKKKEFVICPIDRFSAYFDIIAKFRIKKSGSTSPSPKDYQMIKDAIMPYYSDASFITNDGKFFATIEKSITKDHFVLGKYTYLLAKRNPDFYEIRRLSNTYNMNVIFSICIKSEQEPNDLLKFTSDLNKKD